MSNLKRYTNLIDPEDSYMFGGLFHQVLRESKVANNKFSVFKGISPATDVKELSDQYIIEVEMPGIKIDTLSITTENNVLQIGAEKNISKTEEGATAHRVERMAGSYFRSFVVGSGLDLARTTADYVDGVLTIRIPKSEDAKPRKIAVNQK